jgi:hypothetical protein
MANIALKTYGKALLESVNEDSTKAGTSDLVKQGTQALNKTPSGAASTEAGRDANKYVVPSSVQRAAKNGLALRKVRERLKADGKIGSSESLGGTDIGVARAVQLASGDNISASAIKRMAAYFTRHAKDKDAAGFGNDAEPSAGYVAWMLWGGDAGADWAKGVAGKMEEAVAATTSSRTNKAKPLRGKGRAIANIYTTSDVTLSIQLNLSDLQALFSGKEVEITARDLKRAADQNNIYRVFVAYNAKGSEAV